MSTNMSVDMVQPWRKSFPICKPPVPGDPVDAERFILEFPEGTPQGAGGHTVPVGESDLISMSSNRQCEFRHRGALTQYTEGV